MTEHETPEVNELETAQTFIASELAEAKKNLKTLQIGGSLLIAVLGVYLGGIAGKFHRDLQPQEAAKIAKGLLMQRIDEAQPQLASYLREQAPAMIQQVPDYAMQQMPVYRESIEQDLESKFAKFANDTSAELDNLLDTFLQGHVDEFREIILSGQDKEVTDKVAADLRDMFVAYLADSSQGGESIQDKLDHALKALHDIEKKTTRLANAKDLTPQEAKTRRAIAVLFKTIEDNKDAWGLPTKEGWQESISAFVPNAE